MNILYIYPEPGIPHTVHDIWSEANETLPDTLLMGANRLSDYGFNVDYLAPPDYSILRQSPSLYTLHQIDAFTKLHKYDLIVCKDLRTGLFLGYLRQAGLISTPLVLLDLVLSKDTPFQSFLRYALLGFDRIVCATPQMYEYANDQLHIPVSKLKMIPWSIDLKFWNQNSISAESKDNLIVSCGSNHRDFQTLIDALENTRFDLELITSGSVPNHDRVVQNTYHPTELRKRYLQAKFVILPLYDVPSASGITSFLESLAMGTPVIISDSSGIRDFVYDDHNAVLVPCGSSEAIRDAIQRLNNDKFYDKLAENGREYVEANHNISILTKQVAMLYQTVINNK